MKKSLFALVLVLSLSLNLGFLGMIFWHHWQRGRIERFHPFYHERFGLSKEKVAKMEETRRSLMRKMKPISQELDRERRELIHLLLEPEPNQEKIDQKLNNIQSLQGKLQSMLVESLLFAKENLTPEEQKRFFKFIMGKMDLHRPGQGIKGPRIEKRGGEKR